MIKQKGSNILMSFRDTGRPNPIQIPISELCVAADYEYPYNV